MSSPIDFYYFTMSAPSRAVWMVLEELGINYTDNIVDISKGELKTEEYKKINYRQKIPAIKDGDFCLAESRAVAMYLASKYGAKCGKADLYPQDLQAKAVVDQHLFIDENLWDQIISYVSIGGVISRGEQTHTEYIDRVTSSLKAMEDFLNMHEWIADNKFTIADIFSYITVGILALTDFNDFSPYPKLSAWKKKMSKLPYHKKTCEIPLASLREIYQKKLKENNAKK